MMKRLLLATIIFLILMASSVLAAAEQDPDKNIKRRGWQGYTGQLGYFDFIHPLDPKGPPQLTTLVEGTPRPVVTSLHRVYKWDTAANQPSSETESIPEADDGRLTDYANLIGFAAAGKNILVPESGYDLGGGYEVFVLYADDDSITLKYTCEDDVVFGYTIHLIGFNVDPQLLALYRQLDAAGRAELPILKAGMVIGAGDGELLVSIRDTGRFMDARWENDWWQSSTAASGIPLELNSQPVCPGGSCEDPLTGPTDDGCYRGASVSNSGGTTVWDNLLGKFKKIFHWGGDDQKIKITKQTIPVKGDLPYLLGRFPFGTPPVADENALEVFEDGVVPKLTPPGEQLETLHAMLPSYLEDYSKVITEAELTKSPDAKPQLELSAPDVWGLRNSAIRLAFNLVEPPGTPAPQDAFTAFKTTGQGATQLAGSIVPRGELLCQAKGDTGITVARSKVRTNSAAVRPTTTPTKNIRLAQNAAGQNNINPNVTLAAATSSCQSTTADDKPLCIREGEGVFAEREEPQECEFTWERRDCIEGTTGICPTDPTLVCPSEGFLNCVIPNCDSTSTSGVRFNPKVSFLPDYTQYIIDTYSIFKTPGLQERDLYGESEEFEWTFGGEEIKADDKILYKKLGTVECLQNYVQRTLSPPGHTIAEKQGCFEL